jgi:hypothetical protein
MYYMRLVLNLTTTIKNIKKHFYLISIKKMEKKNPKFFRNFSNFMKLLQKIFSKFFFPVKKKYLEKYLKILKNLRKNAFFSKFNFREWYRNNFGLIFFQNFFSF